MTQSLDDAIAQVIEKAGLEAGENIRVEKKIHEALLEAKKLHEIEAGDYCYLAHPTIVYKVTNRNKDTARITNTETGKTFNISVDSLYRIKPEDAKDALRVRLISCERSVKDYTDSAKFYADSAHRLLVEMGNKEGE